MKNKVEKKVRKGTKGKIVPLHTDRKGAEEKLRELEKEKTLVLDNTIEIIAHHDTNHNLQWANKAYLKATGLSLQEIKGQKCYLAWGLDRLCNNCPVTKAIETGEPQKAELTPQNQEHWPPDQGSWMSVATPVKDTTGNVIGVIEIATDITERKKIEKALRESEDRFRNIFNNTVVGLYRTTPDGQILMANPAILRMLGYESFEELAGRNLEKEGFEPAYSRSDFKERIETEGQVMGLESAWKRRDNTILYIRESAKAVRDKFGNTLYYEGTIEDITERKQAEEELRKIQESTQQFNEKLKVLHEITNELTKAGSTDEVCRLAVELGRKKLGFPRIGIWLKDSDPEYIRGTFGTDKNGNICDERDFSYKVRDMKKAPWKRVFFEHEEMSIEHDCQLQDAQGKAVGKGSRVSVRIWDGKDSIGIIFVDDLLEPGAITDRQVTIIESFASTIGHLYSQKRAEEEISLFAGTLAEKNKELESIMNIAAHDLRTPLVNIKGFGDLLQNNLQQLRSIVNESELSENLKNELETIFTEDIYENLKFIKMGTEMLDSLLKALLRLARLGRAAVGFQKLNMNEMISDITGSIKYHLDAKNVKLTIEPLPDCYGDKAMVGEVFLNLLSNAVKYLDPSRPAVITLSGSKKRDRIIYCVRDNGFGIDPEVQEHVFDIFYRIRHGEQHVDGEGMGLTIVRRIMDFHEGKVRLESEKGIGSKFYVSFPAAKEPLSKRILEIKKGIVPAGTIPRQESYR